MASRARSLPDPFGPSIKTKPMVHWRWTRAMRLVRAKVRPSRTPKANGGRHCCRPPLSPLLARLHIQRLSSPRPSAVPCPSVSALSDGLLKSALPSGPSASRGFLVRLAFSPAASAVPDHMGLAVAGAVATFSVLPRVLSLLACCLLRSFGHRSLGLRAHAPCLRTDSPAGSKRALPRVLACCPSLRFRRLRRPVLRPSVLPHPPCFGTPFRHPEPVLPVCASTPSSRASAG